MFLLFCLFNSQNICFIFVKTFVLYLSRHLLYICQDICFIFVKTFVFNNCRDICFILIVVKTKVVRFYYYV